VSSTAFHSSLPACNPSPAPFVLAGVFGFMALSIVAHHPLIFLLGGAFVAGKLARRHRWHRGHDRSHGESGRPRERRVRHGEAQRAHAAARAAVESSEVVSAEERKDLVAKLDAGLEQVMALESARRRIGGIDDDRLRDVADRARERAVQFVADCDRIRTAVAALEVQGKETAGLDELARAAQAVADRIAARKEVDDLEK